MSDNKELVIVTSFWNRPQLLKSLYYSTSLSLKIKWKMLVVDNGSCGPHKAWIDYWGRSLKRSNVEIITREAYSKNLSNRMSSAEHGAALDVAMKHLNGCQSLIVIMDSDIIWMKPRWNELFEKLLDTHDHITTVRKDCEICPAPYISAFYKKFIDNNNITFAPRTDERLQVLRPTAQNDVGWMMNNIRQDKWAVLSQKTPGIGYSRALLIKHEEEIIAEHLSAGRKRKNGRIESWTNACLDILKSNIKKDSVAADKNNSSNKNN
jgi:hypothetical protein